MRYFHVFCGKSKDIVFGWQNKNKNIRQRHFIFFVFATPITVYIYFIYFVLYVQIQRRYLIFNINKSFQTWYAKSIILPFLIQTERVFSNEILLHQAGIFVRPCNLINVLLDCLHLHLIHKHSRLNHLRCQSHLNLKCDVLIIKSGKNNSARNQIITAVFRKISVWSRSHTSW